MLPLLRMSLIILDLKANPNKAASGTVVEAFLDKGKGYVSTILVQDGTLKIGDYMLAGKHHGKVKAMHDERGNIVTVAGPSTPVSVLGLDGAATAGDKFNIFEDEKDKFSVSIAMKIFYLEAIVTDKGKKRLNELREKFQKTEFLKTI